MKHEELIDFTQKILETNYLPVYKFTLPCENLEHLDQRLRYHILGVKNTSQFFQDLLEKLKPGKVYFNTDLFQCTFVFLLLPDEKTVFYCGPVVFEKMQGERFEELFSSLPLKETYHDAIQTYYQRLPFLGSYALFESLFLELGKKLYGDSCEVVYSNTDFFDHWNNAYKHCLRDQEHPFSNIDVIEKRYESENMLINAVASGRESQTLELISKFETWLLPQRTTNNLRDMKNYTITLNTLLRKAAEQAGVHPILIDAYSNCNVVMLESLTSPQQCLRAQQTIALGYCRIIKEHQHQIHSPLIRKVVAYLETDLSADLTLNNLASHLGVNASYLSTLFSKEMGTSLTDYVNHYRIEHAQTLLANTDVPIKDIALRCGIGDIHYFTRLFKKISGATPKAWRESTSILNREGKKSL